MFTFIIRVLALAYTGAVALGWRRLRNAGAVIASFLLLRRIGLPNIGLGIQNAGTGIGKAVWFLINGIWTRVENAAVFLGPKAWQAFTTMIWGIGQGFKYLGIGFLETLKAIGRFFRWIGRGIRGLFRGLWAGTTWTVRVFVFSLMSLFILSLLLSLFPYAWGVVAIVSFPVAMTLAVLTFVPLWLLGRRRLAVVLAIGILGLWLLYPRASAYLNPFSGFDWVTRAVSVIILLWLTAIVAPWQPVKKCYRTMANLTLVCLMVYGAYYGVRNYLIPESWVRYASARKQEHNTEVNRAAVPHELNAKLTMGRVKHLPVGIYRATFDRSGRAITRVVEERLVDGSRMTLKPFSYFKCWKASVPVHEHGEPFIEIALPDELGEYIVPNIRYAVPLVKVQMFEDADAYLKHMDEEERRRLQTVQANAEIRAIMSRPAPPSPLFSSPVLPPTPPPAPPAPSATTTPPAKQPIGIQPVTQPLPADWQGSEIIEEYTLLAAHLGQGYKPVRIQTGYAYLLNAAGSPYWFETPTTGTIKVDGAQTLVQDFKSDLVIKLRSEDRTLIEVRRKPK